MTLTLADAYIIPDDAGALGFVVQLGGDGKKPEELIRDYVFTPGVREMLPGVFDRLHHLFDQRSGEAGWFVHGSFGSGKSHFMALLSYLLEDRDLAWAKDDPLVGQLAAAHRGWIAERRPLVVRENLLSAAKGDNRFDRLVYEAVNKALGTHGKPPFEFLDVDGVLDEARREGELYGSTFWRAMEAAEVIGGPEDFERIASGQDALREALALEYLRFKGRDPAATGFSPAWAEGLRRMASHVREQGFGGIVFFLDEMLLWLSGKDGPAYKEAINQLNVMVDHSDGARDVPLALFVARQRRFSEFFPDMVDEEQLHDHLDHHGGRFETITLEDVELRYICRERILRQSRPDDVRAAVDRLANEQRALLPTLLQGADEQYLRDVYPFHPAIIEALIDISSLMQRDRTALRLLYELLREHKGLPLGAFIPVGSAFDVVFPGTDFSSSRKVEHLRNIQRIHQQRIAPTLDAMSRDLAADGFDADRRRAADQLIKTALLAEASLRLKGQGRITVKRLVGLNDFDIVGETARGRLTTAAADLAELSRRVPAVQISGGGGEAEIGIALEGADFGEILERAKGQVDNPARRFRTFYDVLLPLLGLGGRPGFGAGTANDGAIETLWRGTRRSGTVSVGNVREMPYERFRLREGEFRIVIDYPWDEPGHTVEEDRQRALSFRRSEGSEYALVWLPRHFDERETQVLVDLAASEFIASAEGADKLLATLAAADRDRVVLQAKERARTLRAEVERILRSAYKDHGEAVALTSDVAGNIPLPDLHANLDHFARELLDRRYPQHPPFVAEVRLQDLRALLDWMLAAADTSDRRAPYDDAAHGVLRAIGEPLELVSIGQSMASLRLDTRYIADVLGRFQNDTVLWSEVDNHLHETYGFQPSVRNLFLLFVARLHSYRALHDTSGQTLGDLPLENRPYLGLRLERARVLDAARWSQARELGASLFGLPQPHALPTLATQDAWSSALRQAGHARRQALQQGHELLAPLVDHDCERLTEMRLALQRLAPLDDPRLDPHQTLSALIDAWPPDAGDPIRDVVRSADAALAAAGAIDRLTVANLKAAIDHPELGADAAQQLAELTQRVAESHLSAPLGQPDIARWNASAQALVRRIMQHAAPAPAPDSALDGAATTEGRHAVWQRRRIAAADRAALDQALGELGDRIDALSADGAEVEVDVTVTVIRKDGA